MPITFRRRPRAFRGPRLDAPVTAPTIRTERATLRPHRLTAADAEAWYALHRDCEAVSYLNWPVRSRRAARQHLRARTRHTLLWQADDFMALAIELDGELAGDVSLHLRSVRAATRSAEVGWILRPQFMGRGLAAEAAEAMLKFAFDTVGVQIVFAEIDESNASSLALAKRFEFEIASISGNTVTLTLTERHFRTLSRSGKATAAR